MENGSVTERYKDNLTVIAGAIYALDIGYDVWSKKDETADGGSWIIIWKPYDEASRVKGEGGDLAEALDNAFKLAGVGGLAWSLAKLEVRVKTLQSAMGAAASWVFDNGYGDAVYGRSLKGDDL